MNTLREIFDLIAEHPFVTLFITYCVYSVASWIENLVIQLKQNKSTDI